MLSVLFSISSLKKLGLLLSMDNELTDIVFSVFSSASSSFFSFSSSFFFSSSHGACVALDRVIILLWLARLIDGTYTTSINCSYTMRCHYIN
jgi:hypothetical protein